ncbi:hypothetical protein NC652_029168 [Populus alba x Populus x berolinensis]|nr:hypothetical protein NC652_028779 [Populus alba x Populus x berolinensis]KAJ6888065.1 hypothetical protein NC652_029168 [Populus alba x Populus x berolinensis]
MALQIIVGLHVVTGGKNGGGGCGLFSNDGRLVADVIVGFYGSVDGKGAIIDDGRGRGVVEGEAGGLRCKGKPRVTGFWLILCVCLRPVGRKVKHRRFDVAVERREKGGAFDDEWSSVLVVV